MQKKIFIIFISIIVFVAPSVSYAVPMPQSIVPSNCQGPDSITSCGCQDLIDLVQNIMNIGVILATFYCGFLIAYEGYKMIVNARNPYKLADAKNALRNVIIGLILALSAWYIVDIFLSAIGSKIGSGGDWSAICS